MRGVMQRRPNAGTTFTTGCQASPPASLDDAALRGGSGEDVELEDRPLSIAGHAALLEP